MHSEPRSNFRLDIQGLRAVAVIAVVVYHSIPDALPGGYTGVDVFFVISGFLITDHLYRGYVATGRVDFAKFYSRRALRILPAALLVVLLTVVASAIFLPPLLLEETLSAAIATALYVPNMYFAFTGTNYLAETVPSVFQHYWSLGVEEQFYVLWPLTLLLVLAITKKNRRWLVPILGILILVSFVAGILLTVRSQPWAFFSLPTRAWELGTGGVLAIVLARLPKSVRLSRPVSGAIAAVGFAGLLWAFFVFDETVAFPGVAAAIPVVSTACLLLAGAHGSHVFSQILTNRVAIFIGAISYSMYLVHWPLIVITEAHVGYENPLPIWVALVLGACSVPLGYLSYRFVEQPTRRLRFAASMPRRTVIMSTAVSASIAAILLIALPAVSGRDFTTSRTAEATNARTSPMSASYVPINLRPALRNASDSVPAIYADGCHDNTFTNTEPRACEFDAADEEAPLVALVGDSHAAQWFPALERLVADGRISLVVYTKSSCPASDYPVLLRGVAYGACDDFRAAVQTDIQERQPDIVLLSSYGDGYAATSSTATFSDDWKSGIESFIKKLPASTTPVVLLDTPNLRATPAICLSAHVDSPEDCAASRADALDSDATRAERMLKVQEIDMSDYFCDSRLCPVIIGNELVYRDSHHVTVEWSERLAGVLGDRIESIQ
ncbi:MULTISPECIES: acyltransferase family protein [unclassified Microbacterium]|uniref:acyltransferase family protein n=1 Tax=unclassified Microbacterium TaxID=2609290 RepID=UPI001604F094|nr:MULTISPECIES: acyltransferase family protein [unclassified Microbacterium]QNA91990.1 acyltransferase [Microbacterium sp. Se63.02b]QYM65220.1 acyltransferase [Microbacterium sp. Se5.02b]